MKKSIPYDLVCFSPVGWNSPEERTHLLMDRFAIQQRVFFVEQPVLTQGPTELEVDQERSKLWSVTPKINLDLGETEHKEAMTNLLKQLVRAFRIQNPVMWYGDVGAYKYTRHIQAVLVVYDVFNLEKRPAEVDQKLEVELLQNANVVVSDGQMLTQSFLDCSGPRFAPGRMDLEHFWSARQVTCEPKDQAAIPYPRIGFMGVINQTLDQELLRRLAEKRPDWHFVMIGPTCTDWGAGLNRENIHYLSEREYHDLPAYLAGWDVGILPLVKEPGSSRYTALQIPQYLAAGLPVVATPIPALVRSYSSIPLAWFGENVDDFEFGIEKAIEARRTIMPNQAGFEASLVQCAWNQAWEWTRETIDDALYSQTPEMVEWIQTLTQPTFLPA